jgi:hypothetical protein
MVFDGLGRDRSREKSEKMNGTWHVALGSTFVPKIEIYVW